MMSVGLHCRLVGRPGRAAALARFLDYVQRHEQVWVAARARHRPPLAGDASAARGKGLLMIFPGFVLEHVTTSAGAIRLRRGGSGPPLLLLHGNPQTHAMWHARGAGAGASASPSICPDLRGYGGSRKPAGHARTTRPTPSGRWRATWSR